MATIGGGYAVASALAFGMPDVQTQNYYANQIRNLSSMGSASGFSEGFLNAAINVVDALDANSIINKATAAVNKIRGFLRANVISRLVTMEDLQVAGSEMQRYLMVDPMVRERTKEQRMHGYKDTYTDPFPHLATEDHPDYRDSMTGIVQSNAQGDTFWMQYQHNRNVHEEPEQNSLTSEQKFCIVDSRAMMREFLAAGGKDPSDGWNGDL